MPIQIHWQEGLFLQPHHLQRMQKSLRDEISGERRLGWPYPYGVVEARRRWARVGWHPPRNDL